MTKEMVQKLLDVEANRDYKSVGDCPHCGGEDCVIQIPNHTWEEAIKDENGADTDEKLTANVTAYICSLCDEEMLDEKGAIKILEAKTHAAGKHYIRVIYDEETKKAKAHTIH